MVNRLKRNDGHVWYNTPIIHEDMVNPREKQAVMQINRKHQLNEHFFATIETERQAYWLGFVWADAGWSKTAPRSADYNRLTIALHERDIQHLETFRTDIDTDYNLSKLKKDIYSLSLNSRTLCDNLRNLGFGLKNERVHIPVMPPHLIHHFLRGYFDGDGCLSLYTQNVKNRWFVKKQEWSLTGNPNLLSEFQVLLEQQVGVSHVKLKQYKRTTAAVSLRYGKLADVTNICEYMYQDATRYLDRKHDKFLELLSR